MTTKRIADSPADAATPTDQPHDVLGQGASFMELRDRLLTSSEFWQKVVESLPDIITILDSDARILFSTSIGKDGRRQDLLGMDGLRFVPEERRARVRRQIDAVFATGETHRYVVEAYDLAGEEAVYDNRVAPLEVDGTIVAVIISSTKRTEHQEMLEDLQNSQERYQSLVDTAPVGIAVHDGGTFRFANPAAARMVGADDPRDLVGRNVLDFVDHGHMPVAADRIRKILVEGKSATPLETPVVRLDGTKAIIEVTGSSIVYKGEDAVQIVLRDVTAERAATERARELHARLSAVAENAPVVLFGLDTEGVFTTSEGRGLGRIGLEPGEVVGLSAFDVYAHNPEFVAAIERCLGGESLTTDIEEQDVVFRTNFSPMYDDEGTVTGLVGVATDVTEQVAYERELRAHRERLEELVAARTQELKNANEQLAANVERRRRAEMAAKENLARLRQVEASRQHVVRGVAHDMATPLTTLQNVHRIIFELNQGKDRTEGLTVDAKSMRIIGRALKQIEDLTTDLRDLGRLESGQLDLKARPIDLTAHVQRIIETYQPIMHEAGPALTLDVQQDLIVEADPKAIDRVLGNLIMNAFKFTLAGTVAVRIRRQESWARIEVADTGAGVPSDETERIFSLFESGRAARTGRYGTGLGLYISRQLVERHGGKIECKSEGEGKGSLFWFTLPLA